MTYSCSIQTVPNHFSLMYPEMCFKRTCFMIFPGSKMRLTGWLFSGFFFWPLLKRHASFVFMQLSGLSPDFHHLSKMTESGTVRILAISWPPMDVACHVLWSSTGQVLTSNPHFLLVVLIIEPFLLNREAWEILFVRTEAKMTLSNSAISVPTVTHPM